MVKIDVFSYVSFLSTFAAMGGTKRTPVFFIPPGANLVLLASFVDQGVSLFMVSAIGIPSTFGSDFPQAVACENIEFA